MANTYYKPGDWNVICDVCGRKYKSSQVKQRWDGLIVCEQDWEPRHPQDFLRSVPDRQEIPYSRPEPADQFVSLYFSGGTSTINQNVINGFGIND